MMTTEVHAEYTNISERTAPFPANQRTSEVIILGDDALTHAIETRTNESPETRFAKGIQNEKQELDQWLTWQVKNQLVVQIIKEQAAITQPVNLTQAYSLVARELGLEKDRHFQGHLRIENEDIPSAMLRAEMPVSFRTGTGYWAKDIDNLQVRSDIHAAMVEYIDTLQATREDGLYDLTEAYIHRMLPVARQEALSSLLQEQARLKTQTEYHQELITKLQYVIGGLESQLEDRDEQLHDQSLELHLARHARDLAA